MLLPPRCALALVLLLGVAWTARAAPDQACIPPAQLATPADPALAALQRGNQLLLDGRPLEALAAYDESRAAALLRGDDQLEDQADANRARAAVAAGRFDGVAADLDRLASAADTLPAREQSRMLIHVGQTTAKLGKATGSQTALLQAAERLERAHAAAEAAGDARLRSFALGYLAARYYEDGQLDPALRLVERALRAGLEADASDALFRWRWQAGRIHAAAGRLGPALAAYRQAGATLIELREQAAVSGVAWKAVLDMDIDALYEELVDLVLQQAARTPAGPEQQALLAEARNALEARKADELRDYFEDECLAALRQKAPDDVPGAVVIYPVLLPDRVEIIVGGAGMLTHTVVPVDRDTLTAAVRTLRYTLSRQTTREYRRYAAQIYEWLIRPIEAELATRAPQTLVFVPEGPLRTIPFSALYDERAGAFLIERYAIAIVPSLTLTDPRPLPRAGIQMLAAGLSESVAGFPALGSVKAEIETLNAAYPGEVLLNAGFEVAKFEAAIESRPFGIVHIASHAEFSEDPSQSFLLAYDGKLSMDRLAHSVGTTRFRATQPLELLTLSACETAAGNDRAALGLAGIALRAGARSALATLWSINDQSSTKLVTRFYAELGDPSISRAEALRRAQRAMLLERGVRHPAFWAPFVLISSWL